MHHLLHQLISLSLDAISGIAAVKDKGFQAFSGLKPFILWLLK